MPRRNHRERYEPADLTPPGEPKPHRLSDRPEILTPRQRSDRERERAQRQREARILHGIDWSVCLVPGCGQNLMIYGGFIPPEDRNVNTTLPLCFNHAVMIWQQVQRDRWLPEVIETAEQLHARHVAEEAARQHEQAQAFKARRDGLMYFVRINDLVKVGWTRDFRRRLKEYGAGAVVLCHYPATSDDETTLHRQLRSVLAKGREWYHDGDVIQLFVTQAIERHGPPTITKADWTEPRKDVIKLRRR